jgi:hypothetical protein
LTIADLAIQQSLYEHIDFRPSRTDWNFRSSLSLLSALVVGEVNYHLTSLIDGVLVRLGSINLRYRNSTAILVTNTNIFEPDRQLASLGLGIGCTTTVLMGTSCRLRFGSASIAPRFGCRFSVPISYVGVKSDI